jgi:hypothetical protein
MLLQLPGIIVTDALQAKRDATTTMDTYPIQRMLHLIRSAAVLERKPHVLRVVHLTGRWRGHDSTPSSQRRDSLP